MSKKLLIVESPSKAKTISKYVGNDFTVKASVGHIRDLPKSNKDAIDIGHGFVPRYVISEGKDKVVSELKKLAKESSEVILATDPDREGEAISWHIAQVAGLKDPKRIVLHEITKKAIEEALAHPKTIDEKLVKAQEARRVLDRLVGYDLSGLIWKKIRYGLSAGRVQSPALRILVEREREIRAFVPEQYWVIKARLKTLGKEEVEFTCDENPKTLEEADRIVDEGKNGEWKVTDITEEKTSRKPRAPFTTSTLQQAASSRLGYSPGITMKLAQKLYEAGLITYMRTDSTNLGADAVAQITNVIEVKYGKECSTPRVYKTKVKNAQEAHEAIRPTNANNTSAGGTDQEKKLYNLIWQRTVASQMTDATVLKNTIKACTTKANIPTFSVIGSRTIFEGWLKADPQAKGEEVEVPKLTLNEKLDLENIEHEGKQTEPPHRYSEAGLIKELEKRGIGRPSTYAAIIQTLLLRKYVDKVERSLQPTDVGEIVSSFLEENFGNIISDTFTANMENDLDLIADGHKEYGKTLKDFYDVFSKQVTEKGGIPKVTNLGEAPADILCPVCGGPMIFKLGRGGKFLSCKKFPECEGARAADGKELAKPEETGESCPECKEGKLISREGKFGKFISCNRYPKCKYIKKGEPISSGVNCPECKTGVISERRGRFGTFWSCSNYPKCRFAIKAKPTGAICELCGSLMMEGTKTIPVRCSNKECKNHKPQQS
jgi:DNA topoisomerase-1